MQNLTGGRRVQEPQVPLQGSVKRWVGVHGIEGERWGVGLVGVEVQGGEGVGDWRGGDFGFEDGSRGGGGGVRD